MADLRDALRQSGVVDEKKARRLAHEEAARKKKLGQPGIDEERALQDAQRREREDKRRETDRERAQRQRDDDARRESRGRLVHVLTSRALTEGVSGPVRFHFVTRDRKIPHLDLSERAADGLTDGHLAICLVPDSRPERFVLVTAETARAAREIDGTCVLFFNDRPQQD